MNDLIYLRSVVAATKDPELAGLLSRSVDSRITFIADAFDATDLRHRIHQLQPSVVVIDVRFGGSGYRVLGAVPRLEGVTSRPQAIALLPWFAQDAYDEAITLGCFDVLALTSSDFSSEVARAVTLAEQERAAKLKKNDRAPRFLVH